MNKTPLVHILLIGSLMTPAALWANDSNDATATETMKHPVKTYDAHQVRSEAKDTAVYQQKMKEVQAQLEQAQKDLAASQSADVKEKAQKRVDRLQKKYDQLAKKLTDEKKELGEARKDLNQDMKEINQNNQNPTK